MLFKTKYFGQIDHPEEGIYDFPNGIYGFEDEKQFLLLPFEGSENSMFCLQSVRTPSLAFVMMNPFSLKPDYKPVLQPDECRFMGVEHSEDLCYYVLCALKKPVAESTMNLKSPIVLNNLTQHGMQAILESSEYGMRHSLSEFHWKAGGEKC